MIVLCVFSCLTIMSLRKTSLLIYLKIVIAYFGCICPEVIKLFVLNSTENEIYHARKC